MANQVLSRPMFKPSPNQVAPTVSGIGSMTTPDQNAQALKTMFAPQPAYKRGGEVIDGVAHFAEGDEVVAPEPSISQFQRDLSTDPTPAQTASAETRRGEVAAAIGAQQSRVAAMAAAREEALKRSAGTPPVPGYFGASDPAKYEAEKKAREAYLADTEAQARRAGEGVLAASPGASTRPSATTAEDRLRAAGLAGFTPEALAAMEDKDRRDTARPNGMFSVGTSPKAAPPPPDPKDETIQTSLQAIRERREASEKQREENKNLALLSAGLGMMAGTNRNAFANIGTGGQQGIATFAGLEKTRREDEATRRREDILTAQMNQQMKITKMQLAQDPEQVRVYKALGGGDLVKGFQLVSSDKILEAAVKLSADFTADPTKRANAVNFINQRIQESSGARPGAAGGLPPGSTVRSATDFVAAGK